MSSDKKSSKSSIENDLKENKVIIHQSDKTQIEKDLQQKSYYSDQNYHSDVLQLVDLLQNPKNLESNTILDNNEQVVALTLMNWAGQVFDIEPFKQFVASYPKYKISGDSGTGRKQSIQVAEAIRREKIESDNRWMEFLRRR